MKKTIAITLFLCIFFIGCVEEPEDDKSIGEITITGIPAEIPVLGNETVKNTTYKVYLNASNSQDPKELLEVKGKGWAEIPPDMEKAADGTYTVTIQLKKPNPPSEKDPTYETGFWSGTANYFSIVISPKNVSENKENSIWANVGYTFDKTKASCVWSNGENNSKTLMDFRGLLKIDSDGKMKEKLDAMFWDIVCEDKDTNMVKPVKPVKP